MEHNIHGLIRYIFTKVDNTPKYVMLKHCNICPFLINDYNNGEAKCCKFSNPNPETEDKNFITKVYGYRQLNVNSFVMQIMMNVNIPTWCGLPKHLVELSPNDAITTVKDKSLFIESGQNYSDVVQIMPETNIEVDSKDGESLIFKKESNIIYPQSYKQPIIKQICSSCGEDKKDVSRDKHDGMCGDCWGNFKKNKKKRHYSYINNFRLKRKETWKNDEFKMILK
jgi:hypothetical protein